MAPDNLILIPPAGFFFSGSPSVIRPDLGIDITIQAPPTRQAAARHPNPLWVEYLSPAAKVVAEGGGVDKDEEEEVEVEEEEGDALAGCKSQEGFWKLNHFPDGQSLCLRMSGSRSGVLNCCLSI